MQAAAIGRNADGVVVGTALLVLAAIIGIRLWWLRRRMGAGDGSVPPGPGQRAVGKQTIEGEYHVVIEEKDDSAG